MCVHCVSVLGINMAKSKDRIEKPVKNKAQFKMISMKEKLILTQAVSRISNTHKQEFCRT